MIKKIYLIHFLILIALLIGCTSEKHNENNTTKKDTVKIGNKIYNNQNLCGVKGKIFYNGKTINKAYALANLDENFLYKGMPFNISEPTNMGGEFFIPLPPELIIYLLKKSLIPQLSVLFLSENIMVYMIKIR